MNLVVHDVYELSLASSGKLKLRAKALLAEGTPDAVFRACILLHEAARIQRRAIGALPACPPVTLLSSRVEECWCFVEGRDPLRAAVTWGEMLRAWEGVEAATAEAIVSRLAPRFRAFQQEFARLATPRLIAMADAGPGAGLSRVEGAKARKDLDVMLARFPGAVNFWSMRCHLAEREGDKLGAWDALGRARQLDPGDPTLAALGLGLAPWALPPADAEQYLAGVRGTIEEAEADICLMYALAEIVLARRARQDERALRWGRARGAAEAGRARTTSLGLRRYLTAVQLLLDELVAGREPTMEILYKAGLGEAAAMEKPDANVVDFLTDRSRHLNPEVVRAA
jgi:hypothetical protein